VLVNEIAEEAEHGGQAVELTESSAEAAPGDAAAPALADEGGRRRGRGSLARTAGSGGEPPPQDPPTAPCSLLRRSPAPAGGRRPAERGIWSAPEAQGASGAGAATCFLGLLGWANQVEACGPCGSACGPHRSARQTQPIDRLHFVPHRHESTGIKHFIMRTL